MLTCIKITFDDRALCWEGWEKIDNYFF